jgi:molybdopterin-guanine dinucleotide biosynthesis protein A
MPIAPDQITGLLLAGGRGTRMRGADKGLQGLQGKPMALHALLRLRPQVGPVLISANRNLAAYRALGAPVWPDTWPDFPGPLGGLLAGLAQCKTPYLATVPCDTPNFPHDLVLRLAQALHAEQADVALAATREPGPGPGPGPGRPCGPVRAHPVFCLLHARLLESLQAYLHGGGRQVAGFMALHRCVEVVFDDARAFFNVNTLAELQQLQQLQQAQG